MGWENILGISHSMIKKWERTETTRMHHLHLEGCFYKMLVCYINIHLCTLGGDIKIYLTVDCGKKPPNKPSLKATALVVKFSYFKNNSIFLLFCKLWKWLDLHICCVMGLVLDAALQNARQCDLINFTPDFPVLDKNSITTFLLVVAFNLSVIDL